MREDFFYPSNDGKTKIHAIAWKPEGEIKAVFQIVHGMIEFIDRYEEFANYLTQSGIFVVGHDHIGHGKSVNTQDDWGYFAKKDSVECVIQDIYSLTKQIKQKYPNLPYVILGHSMGSFFTRVFASRYGKELDAVIIMGTGNQAKALQLTGKALAKALRVIYGERHRSKFMSVAMFGAYNKKIEHPRTINDWISKDEKIVDIYQHEPANQFLFTINGIETLLSVVGKASSKTIACNTPKELPMLFVSGDADPVGEYGQAVKRVFNMYQKAGMKDIQIKLFANDRHEVLNETDRQEVYEYLLNWIKNKIRLA